MNISYYINRNGEKQEISANEYKESQHLGRLKCPCCKEKVDWNDGRAPLLGGGTRKKCFKHHHGTKREECENYCSSIAQASTMTTFAKLSLPLYLLKDDSSFSLNIGLYGISEVAINQALQLDLFVKILLNNNVISKKKIDNVNFAPETLQTIKVNHCSTEYNLAFSAGHVPPEINKKWHTAIDINGVGENGAIFYYSQYGGRKVKSDDGLETGKDYFLLSMTRYESYPSVRFEVVGSIIFDSSIKYFVYKLHINAINKESLYFCERFGMALCLRSSQLIPLWPPCKANDREFLFMTKKNKFLILKSDDAQKQTVFSESLQRKLPFESVGPNKLLLKSSALSEDFLSIGGSDQSFICGSLPKVLVSNICTIDIASRDPNDRVIEFTSPAKVKVIRWNGNIPVAVMVTKHNTVEIDKPKIKERLQFLHGLDEVLIITKEKKQNDCKNEDIDDLLSNALNRYKTNFIPVPVSIKWIMLKLKCCPKTYITLQMMINNNKISRDAFDILKQQCLRNRGV